jgi:hypothetical protein
MHLDPTAFNTLLADMGQQVQWRRAHACPCRDERSGAARPGCSVCYGLGHYWSDSVDCGLALTGQRVQAEWAKLGLYESGDVVVSLPSDSPAYALGPFDRVTFTQSSVPDSVVLRDGDRVREPVVAVDKATYFNGDTLTEITPPPSIAASGLPVYTGGTAPPDGAQVALTLRRHPEYFALQEFPQDRAHHGGKPLPRRVVLRKFDLFGRA